MYPDELVAKLLFVPCWLRERCTANTIRKAFAFCVSILVITEGHFMAWNWSLISMEEKSSGHLIATFQHIGGGHQEDEAKLFRSM